jgi:hypothetical protein
MEKSDLLKIIESKFNDLDDIFHNTNINERDEDEQVLYDAYFNIGIKNIDIIREMLNEIIMNTNNFQFNRETYEKMISDDYYHKIILDFIWDIDYEEHDIENHKKVLNEDEYYEKLKNGLNNVQINSIENITNNNFENGIVCIATGGGKSLIILKCIDIFNNLLNMNRSILIFTERKNILLDLFYIFEKESEKYKPNHDYWNVWKRLNIINMEKFNLINYFKRINIR